jgi:hypothetical protein
MNKRHLTERCGWKHVGTRCTKVPEKKPEHPAQVETLRRSHHANTGLIEQFAASGPVAGRLRLISLRAAGEGKGARQTQRMHGTQHLLASRVLSGVASLLGTGTENDSSDWANRTE